MLRFLTIWNKLIFTKRETQVRFFLSQSIWIFQLNCHSLWFDRNILLLFLIINNFLPDLSRGWVTTVHWKVHSTKCGCKSKAQARRSPSSRGELLRTFYTTFAPCGLKLLKIRSVKHEFCWSYPYFWCVPHRGFKKRPARPIQSWTCTAFTWRISFFLM